MTDLQRRRVFLSASLPVPDREDEAGHYSPSEITDAVAAFAKAILEANGRIVSGGHPAITPILLWAAREHATRESIDLFQTEWFAATFPQETWELADDGYAMLTITPSGSDRPSSLAVMRAAMFDLTDLAGAVFIGGMKGITDEYDLLHLTRPDLPLAPLSAPGGAASRLAPTPTLPEVVVNGLASRRYPYVAAVTLSSFAE